MAPISDEVEEVDGDSLFRTHKVTPLDNLAGIAIKYGVTIRDIKRANGGMISDATLFARGTLRIPRHALAEGAPLPGGGGVTGDASRATGAAAQAAASMTPALQKLRGYYGLKPGDEGYGGGGGGEGGGGGGGGGSESDGGGSGSGSSGMSAASTSGRAGSSANVTEVQMAFMGGEQSVKKVLRSGGGGGGDGGGDGGGGGGMGGNNGGGGGGGGGGRSSGSGAGAGAGAEGRYGQQYTGSGAMSANAFQGRDRSLMSPPKVMTASGTAVAPGGGTGGGKGFFARLKAMANAPAMATPASAPGLGAVMGGVVDQRRGPGGGGGGGGFGGGGSSLPAGQKGKGD